MVHFCGSITIYFFRGPSGISTGLNPSPFIHFSVNEKGPETQWIRSLLLLESESYLPIVSKIGPAVSEPAETD
jgi:hypothetical protein